MFGTWSCLESLLGYSWVVNIRVRRRLVPSFRDLSSSETTMADEEGDDEYVSENVQEIVKHAMNQTLQNAVYSKEKVNHWCNQLLDSCLKELAKLNKPFKYVGIGLGHLPADPFTEVQPRDFLARDLPVFSGEVSVEDFFDLVRNGQPAVFRTAGLGWALVNESCRDFAARWPDGKMSKQYQSHDKRVALGEPDWAEKKPTRIGDQATSAPYVWHVKDRVASDMKKSVQRLLFPLGVAMKNLPWLKERHPALEKHVADSMEFWLQPARAGTLAHNDAYCVNVMSVQLSGFKRWKLMTMPRVDSIAEMFDEFDGGIRRDPSRSFEPDYEYTLGPGEGILFPPGMMHETLSVSENECTTSVTFNIPIPMSARYIRNLLPRLSLSTEFGDCLWDRWADTVTLGLGGMWTDEKLDGGQVAGEIAERILVSVDRNGDRQLDSDEVLYWLRADPLAQRFRDPKHNPDARLAFSKGASLGEEAIESLLVLRAEDCIAYWDGDGDGLATKEELHDALWQWHVIVTRRRVADLALGDQAEPGTRGFRVRAAAAAKLFEKIYASGRARSGLDENSNEEELLLFLGHGVNDNDGRIDRSGPEPPLVPYRDAMFLSVIITVARWPKRDGVATHSQWSHSPVSIVVSHSAAAFAEGDSTIDLYINGNQAPLDQTLDVFAMNTNYEIQDVNSGVQVFRLASELVDGDVVAVRATNTKPTEGVEVDSGHRTVTYPSYGGWILAMPNFVVSSAKHWRCTSEALQSWTAQDFNDTSWPFAVENPGGGSCCPWRDQNKAWAAVNAEWLWTADPVANRTIYCRYTVNTADFAEGMDGSGQNASVLAPAFRIQNIRPGSSWLTLEINVTTIGARIYCLPINLLYRMRAPTSREIEQAKHFINVTEVTEESWEEDTASDHGSNIPAA
ncbi:hypothetical protein FOZ63_012253, partial [Perkinsus olseni]